MWPIDQLHLLLLLWLLYAIVLSGSVASNVSVSSLRSYFRKLDTMKQQLLSISSILLPVFVATVTTAALQVSK